LLVAYVYTVKVPASRTESGLVPPVLNLKEKAEPPLEKVPLVPNGLVRVRTLLETVQDVGARTDDADESVQVPSFRVREEGNVTKILELEGIECAGYIVNVYRAEADTVYVEAVIVKVVIDPVLNCEAVIVSEVYLAILYSVLLTYAYSSSVNELVSLTSAILYRLVKTT
jgi:hypothetical protein